MSRGAIDIVLPNMFSNPEYSKNYLFYAHMIGQCSIVIDEKIPAPAGVAFFLDHYKLYINPTIFDQFALVEQLGVLKHEMEHILNDHVHRIEDRKPLQWNYSTDCAINQLIERSHLPKGEWEGIFPDNFPVKVGTNWTSEQYYEALKSKEPESEPECGECGGSGESEDGDGNQSQCPSCGGSGKGQGSYGDQYGKLLDDHGTWNRSEGDKELQQDLTSQMIERSINETMKARGNLPHNIDHYMKLFRRESQVSWQRVLRTIVGNKKVNSRRTIMRSDRRFPKREDLRGRTKDRLFDLTVIVDISGSMSDGDIMSGLNEIHTICKLTKTKMQLIQVDTVVHTVQEFSEKTTLFNRTGAGGTIMEPAIDYIREEKIPTDAVILITDGYIENVSRWAHPPKYPIIFLTTGGDIPGIENVARYRQFKLDVLDAAA